MYFATVTPSGVTVAASRSFGIFGLAGQVKACPDMKSRCPDFANTLVQASQRAFPLPLVAACVARITLAAKVGHF